MKPEDLMVGDWILLFDKTPVKVACIGNVEVYLSEPESKRALDWVVTYEHIKPIPLTPEILEKNGFLYKNGLWMWSKSKGKIYIRHLANKWSIEVKNELAKKDDFGRADLVSYCRDWIQQLYVHEIQHAISLCGIDKKIVI